MHLERKRDGMAPGDHSVSHLNKQPRYALPTSHKGASQCPQAMSLFLTIPWVEELCHLLLGLAS